MYYNVLTERFIGYSDQVQIKFIRHFDKISIYIYIYPYCYYFKYIENITLELNRHNSNMILKNSSVVCRARAFSRWRREHRRREDDRAPRPTKGSVSQSCNRVCERELASVWNNGPIPR